MATNKKGDSAAALISLLIPGAGQMYNDKIIQGMVWLVATVAGYAFMVIPGLVIHAFCIFDAYGNKEEIAMDGLLEEIDKGHKLRTREMISDEEFQKIKEAAISKFKESSEKPLVNDFLLDAVPLVDSGALSRDDIEEIKNVLKAS